MKDALLRLIGHMEWADALVADALDDFVSDFEPLRLFGHIAAVEHLWFSRIHERPARWVVWPIFTAHEARDLAAEHAVLFREMVEGSSAHDLARIVAYRNSAGHDYESSVADIIMHTTVHGEHHRGQIARLLRAAGRQPPYTDYIQYARRGQ